MYTRADILSPLKNCNFKKVVRSNNKYHLPRQHRVENIRSYIIVMTNKIPICSSRYFLFVWISQENLMDNYFIDSFSNFTSPQTTRSVSKSWNR